jgi:hypothetical protein
MTGSGTGTEVAVGNIENLGSSWGEVSGEWTRGGEKQLSSLPGFGKIKGFPMLCRGINPAKDGFTKIPGDSFGYIGVTERLPWLLLRLDEFDLTLSSNTDSHSSLF